MIITVCCTTFYPPSPHVLPQVYKQQLLTCILSVSPADEGLRSRNVLVYLTPCATYTAQVINPFAISPVARSLYNIITLHCHSCACECIGTLYVLFLIIFTHIRGIIHTWIIAVYMWNWSRLDNITVKLEPGQQNVQAGYNLSSHSFWTSERLYPHNAHFLQFHALLLTPTLCVCNITPIILWAIALHVCMAQRRLLCGWPRVQEV